MIHLNPKMVDFFPLKKKKTLAWYDEKSIGSERLTPSEGNSNLLENFLTSEQCM